MILDVKGLSKEFKRGTGFFKAVDEADFSLDPAEFVSIVGRSGSGKSTLLNMIAGLIKPTSGIVLFNGKEINKLNDYESSRFRNSQIGYVPQGQSILSNLSVIDNVRLPHYLSTREGDPNGKALSLLEQMGISHLANSFPSRLSGGELKRVALARALINSPELVIADEPTCDLDLQTTREILQLLTALAETGVSILAVTHETEVTDYCTRTLLMESGKLVEKI